LIVYSSTKREFIRQVNDHPVEDIILKCFEERLKRTTGASEREAWRDSLPCMAQVLSDDGIPDDAGILIEYMIPQSSFRVDFIITGINDRDQENVVIVELKRWTHATKTEKDAIVKTHFMGGVVETSHPSYQAWSYAAFLGSYNETIYTEKIDLQPCAYLHNYRADGVINDPFYAEHIKRAPLFLHHDKQKLRSFIKQHIVKGDLFGVMYRIENGRIRPSKQLADQLRSMLRGNQEFLMLDEQKIIYETALSVVRSSNQGKKVLIVEGGPGTGKSVVAIQLMVALTGMGKVAKYVTKNSAPRAVYRSRLQGEFTGAHIDYLFTGSGSFVDTPENLFDALIVDEAHRLNEKSGMFHHLGENQIKELIQASRFSVFFIDEDQRVTLKDIGTKSEIRQWAQNLGAEVREIPLKSQFRCNGSDGYLLWLNHTLDLHETANFTLDSGSYDFSVVDSPAHLRDKIYALNQSDNKARMLAGYCWNWISKNNAQLFDIEMPEYGFKHRWNLNSDGMRWIIAPGSVSEIGCIHTCQGLELDHVGVLIGPDFIVRNGCVVTNFRMRARTDKSLSGIQSMFRENQAHATALADRIIKNTYRTLLTRGMRSCTIFCTDEETREYFRARIG
jgi:DUF2075 family protein